MNIKFAINSYIKFWETTIPILVSSMIKSGIDSNDIYVFVGGYDEYISIPNDYDIKIYGVPHNSIDFTGLISLIELDLENEYWFYLHDTCYVGPEFYNKIKNFDYPVEFNSVSVTNGPSMNIGLYKLSIIENNKEKILNKKNKDYSLEKTLEWKRLNVMWEDDIIGRGPLFYCNYGLVDRPQDREEFNNIYGTDTKRAIEYFTELDLYKVKANWNPKDQYEINL
jgi:hypothetical protein